MAYRKHRLDTLQLLAALLALFSLSLGGCNRVPAEEFVQPAPSVVPSLTEELVTSQIPATPAFAGMRVEAPDCTYGGEFRAIAALDEFTVQFALCYPDPAFLSKIASTAFSIQPAEYLELTGGSPLENPIGTGPYRVETWERGKQLVLKAFPGYWGEQPKFKTLIFRWNGNALSRLLELQSGQVDGIEDVDPAHFEILQKDPNFRIVEYATLNVMYLGFNNHPEIAGYDNSRNPFADERVRQAVAYGIDRERIVDQFYPPGSQVATYFTPCTIPNGCVGDPWYEFAPDYAKYLLDQAGYADGFTTKIYYRNVVRPYLARPKDVAEDLKAQLKENLNIDAEVIEMESNDFLESATFGHLDGIHLLGWEMRYPDPIDSLDYHFGGNASSQFGDKFDDITDSLAQAAQSDGAENRRPFYITVNNAIRQHVPMIPVAWSGSALAYKAAIRGAHASPLHDEEFASMSLPGQETFVWLQDAEPVSLYCPDETEADSLRACGQVVEGLYGYDIGAATVKPVLAEKCEPSVDLMEWTCGLRQGIQFHDGSSLDANDVVESFIVQWDAADPLHTGNTGSFTFFNSLFGSFLNLPQ